MSAVSTIHQLLGQSTTASLATLDPSGSPFVTLVQFASYRPDVVLLLLSDLAKHSHHLASDDRASLLIADEQIRVDERMTGTRVTLSGKTARISGPGGSALRQVFVARHPSAEMYASFADFSVYTFQIHQAHLVAGFGRIHTVDADALRSQ
jgi:hypothetical protein